jgi:hypothetical protein
MPIVKLGPGTLTVGTTPQDFSAEVKSASITHEYDETSEAVTYLDGSATPASETRADGFTAEVDNDLTAAGLYDYCFTNDQTEQAFSFTPNDALGAVWEGTVKIKLPSEIGSDQFGNPITSTIEWQAVGALDFTPGTVGP